MRAIPVILALVLIAGLAALVPPPAWGQPADAGKAVEGTAIEPAAEMTAEEQADAEIGKSAAEEVEKRFKILTDSPDAARLQAIIDRLRPVTQKPRQSYQAKVVDSKAINAFSLPGGYLYFTVGLSGAVESEDELAAVVAHEMAHVCLSHSRKMMSRSERYNKILGPLVLASVLSKSERIDPGAMLMVGSLVVEDALNHYGRGAEMEADREAVLYLRASNSYHPVAMLTVAEGLARMESTEPQVDPGVFQTHPFAKDRAAAITAQLMQLGVPIERRRVTGSLVTSAAAVTVRGKEIGELRVTASGSAKPWSAAIFQPAQELAGLSPLARAQRASETLNALLLSDLRPVEVSSERKGDQATVAARNQVLFTITPGDAAFHQTTVDELGKQALQTIRIAFHQEKVGRAY